MILLILVLAVLELMVLAYLVEKIKHTYEISLKDTTVYPFIIILASIVFFVAHVKYGGFESWWEAIPCAFSSALDLVVLDIDTGMIKTLAQQNVGLLINYLLLYVISTFALLSLSISLLRVSVNNFFRPLAFKKEVNYVLGFNDDLKTYLGNLTDEQRGKTCVILSRKEGVKYNEERLFLHSCGVKYRILPYASENTFTKTLHSLTRTKKKYCIIYFFEDDGEIFKYVTFAKKFLKKYNLYQSDIQFVTVADDRQKALVDELIKSTNDDNAPVKDESRGCIRTFNKHDATAFDFVMHHNFAKYFPKNLLNDNKTVKDCDINLFVLGFGKFNQAILKDVLIQTQFATVTNGKLTPKRLNVHVYDDNENYFNLPLSCGIFKYDKSKFNPEHYFDLPDDYVSNTHWHFNEKAGGAFLTSVYDQIKQASAQRPQVNYFIISTGDDCENNQLAQKLYESLENLEATNSMFFVRAQRSAAIPTQKQNFIYFGNENDVLQYRTIVADGVYTLAKRASCAYSNDKNYSNEVWADLTPIKQQSNLYFVVGIPFKLSLLGVENYDIDVEKLLAMYDPKNERGNNEYSTKLTGNAALLTPRDVLAFIEHERWNAFEFSVGAMPMKKLWAQKLGQNKTDNELYHLCLTTSFGLTEYHDFYVQMMNNPDDANVIRYDYELFDKVCASLHYLKED